MQQMLPLILDWLADSPDPDLGLDQLRLLAARLPDHAEMITTLHDQFRWLFSRQALLLAMGLVLYALWLLLGHFDTVWPVGQLARMPLRRDADRLYGPGAFDMKGGVVIGLLALRMMCRHSSTEVP